MNSTALALMLFSMGSVTVATVYFFYKVLTVTKKDEPDSYSENDEDTR